MEINETAKAEVSVCSSLICVAQGDRCEGGRCLQGASPLPAGRAVGQRASPCRRCGCLGSGNSVLGAAQGLGGRLAASPASTHKCQLQISLLLTPSKTTKNACRHFHCLLGWGGVGGQSHPCMTTTGLDLRVGGLLTSCTLYPLRQVGGF